MTTTRRLAAILAADAVGYSRLMGADEEGTLKRLQHIQQDIIDSAVTKCGGRIVKTTGDGFWGIMSYEYDLLQGVTRCLRVAKIS